MPEQITSTSQRFLDIHDITDDILILKNGSTAVVLTINAMNFGLLAEEEQDAVIYSYASLLNSINYPAQVIIRSETKDASSYLQILKEREKELDSDVKRAWIKRYSQFVSNLIKERNVLDKKFYVVIPASNLEMGLTPAQNILSGFKDSEIKDIDTNIILEKALNLLEPKRDHLIAQFNRIGLYARQLKTQEIIRLFYTSYNPEASEGQQITNSQSYTTPLVQAQIRSNLMAQAQKPTQPQTKAQPEAQQPQQSPIQESPQVKAPQKAQTPQTPQATQAPQQTQAQPMPKPQKPAQPTQPAQPAQPAQQPQATVNITEPQAEQKSPQPAQTQSQGQQKPNQQPQPDQTDQTSQPNPAEAQQNINSTLKGLSQEQSQPPASQEKQPGQQGS